MKNFLLTFIGFTFVYLLSITACKTQTKSNQTHQKKDTLIVRQVSKCLDSPKEEQAKLNVKSFGAKGDGITDDTRAIQSCFESIAKLGKGIAYFPKGIYRVSRTSRSGKSWSLLGVNNLTIEGENQKESVIQLAPNQKNFTRILILNNNHNITIKNIRFDGNVEQQPNPETPNEHLGGVFINQTKDVFICNVAFVNTGGDGIGIRGAKIPSHNITVKDCFFDNNQRNGITLGSGFDGVVVKNCFFGKKIDDSPIDTEPDHGICQNVKILNNHIETPTLLTVGGHSEKSGIAKNFVIRNNLLQDCQVQMYLSENVIFENNQIKLTKSVKSAITCIGYNKNIKIRNNIIDIKGHPAIYLVKPRFSSAPNKIEVSNNQIRIEDARPAGILIKGANNITISKNTIKGINTGMGIYCVSTFPMHGINISNNQIEGFKKGIRIQTLKKNPLDSVIINNNYFIKIKNDLDTLHYNKNLSKKKPFGIIFIPAKIKSIINN